MRKSKKKGVAKLVYVHWQIFSSGSICIFFNKTLYLWKIRIWWSSKGNNFEKSLWWSEAEENKVIFKEKNARLPNLLILNNEYVKKNQNTISLESVHNIQSCVEEVGEDTPTSQKRLSFSITTKISTDSRYGTTQTLVITEVDESRSGSRSCTGNGINSGNPWTIYKKV